MEIILCCSVVNFQNHILTKAILICFVGQVHGVLRRSSSFNTGRIEHLYQNPQTHTEGSKFPASYG